MESSKYICIRETQQDKAAVVIIDLTNPSQFARRPITADNAIMCIDQNFLALKGMKKKKCILTIKFWFSFSWKSTSNF